MISVPSSLNDSNDAFVIRRLAIDSHLPLVTNAETGRLLLRCLADPSLANREPKAWQDYLAPASGQSPSTSIPQRKPKSTKGKR
jgi:hypothetical protein